MCNTHLFFYRNSGCTNEPQCSVIPTLPVFLHADIKTGIQGKNYSNFLSWLNVQLWRCLLNLVPDSFLLSMVCSRRFSGSESWFREMYYGTPRLSGPTCTACSNISKKKTATFLFGMCPHDSHSAHCPCSASHMLSDILMSSLHETRQAKASWSSCVMFNRQF